MKKVKVMLTAITVFAVVGGALAFKAQKFHTKLYCTTQAAVGACTIETPGFSIVQVDPNDNGELSTCTTTNVNPNSQDCSERLTYINQ